VRLRGLRRRGSSPRAGDAVQKGLKYYGIDLVEPGLEEVLRE
jgi:hypothetical protein